MTAAQRKEKAYLHKALIDILSDCPNKLIDEARGKGYAFTFECGEVHFANADTAIIYSDEEDFYVGLEELK